jgi:hypothetical protein
MLNDVPSSSVHRNTRIRFRSAPVYWKYQNRLGKNLLQKLLALAFRAFLTSLWYKNQSPFLWFGFSIAMNPNLSSRSLATVEALPIPERASPYHHIPCRYLWRPRKILVLRCCLMNAARVCMVLVDRSPTLSLHILESQHRQSFFDPKVPSLRQQRHCQRCLYPLFLMTMPLCSKYP